MRKASLITGIIFLAFSLTVMVSSWSMEYYSSIGPGPGFFPFWLSAILGLLAVLWIVQILRSPSKSKEKDENDRLFPRGDGLLRLLSIVGAVFFMMILMEPLGFQLTMFAFLVFLLIVLGRVKTRTTLIVAAIGSFGLFRIFTMLLDVQLPQSAISFLAAIGL